jgi:prevent-host-death family protein
MGTITLTAKELKNRTGDAFRALRGGDKVLLTRRGKAVAMIVPVADGDASQELPPFAVAWAEIEAALSASEPEFPSLAAAMAESRRRT